MCNFYNKILHVLHYYCFSVISSNPFHDMLYLCNDVMSDPIGSMTSVTLNQNRTVADLRPFPP